MQQMWNIIQHDGPNRLGLLPKANSNYLAARAARLAAMEATACVTAAFAHKTQEKIFKEFGALHNPALWPPLSPPIAPSLTLPLGCPADDAQAAISSLLPHIRVRRSLRETNFESRGRLGSASKVLSKTAERFSFKVA